MNEKSQANGKLLSGQYACTPKAFLFYFYDSLVNRYTPTPRSASALSTTSPHLSESKFLPDHAIETIPCSGRRTKRKLCRRRDLRRRDRATAADA